MTNLQETQRRAVDALDAITQREPLWGHEPPEELQLHQAVDAIAEYTIALALDRMAARGCEASAEKLSAVLLTDHRGRDPFPP